jgi:molybdopterin-binding protein
MMRGMELSARNQLKGKVKSVKLGAVMAEVNHQVDRGHARQVGASARWAAAPK